MRNAFIVTTTVLALSACLYTQRASSFDIDAVNKLVPGVSTEQDAIQLLGNPTETNTRDDGTELLFFLVPTRK